MRDVIRPFNARMRTPLTRVIRHTYTDGDTVIEFFDVKSTALDGKPYVNTYTWFLDIRDGKVIAASVFFDSIEFDEPWVHVTPVAMK